MAGECNTVNYCLHIRTHKQTCIHTSAEIWMLSPITQMIWTLTGSESESLGILFSVVLSEYYRLLHKYVHQSEEIPNEYWCESCDSN